MKTIASLTFCQDRQTRAPTRLRCPCPRQTAAPRTGAAPNAGWFSLHAGLDIEPHQRAKLERLCRYVSRPPIAEDRLLLTSWGQVRYQLKTSYRDGTTHIAMEPLDLMARLAALVPPPRMHTWTPPIAKRILRFWIAGRDCSHTFGLFV